MTFYKRWRLGVGLLAALMVAGGCGTRTPGSPDAAVGADSKAAESEASALTATDTVATRPGDARALGGLAIVLDLQWQSLGRQTQALGKGLTALCASPTAGRLDDARREWQLTRRAWMEAQLHEIGPMPRQRLKAQMGWWPANPERIEALINGDQPLTPAFVAGQGSTVKGLYTLEHLLWPADGDDAALLQGLDASTGTAAGRRCLFAAAVAEAMALSWTQANAVWTGPRAAEAPDLAATAPSPLASPASASPASASGSFTPPLQHFASSQAAINALVNRMVFVVQELDGMLAKPLGRRTGGTPQPEAAQGTSSQSTVATIADGLCGIKAVWIGDRSAHCTEPDTADHDTPFPALGDLVRARSPETADHIDGTLAAAIVAVQAIPEPFTRTLADDPARLDAAFQALKALERSMATELVGALGINLTFNANDGD